MTNSGAGLKLLPVGLIAELIDMLGHLLAVAHQSVLAVGFGRSGDGVEIGGERHFGVHDDGAAVGKLHDHVRADAAGFGFVGFLLHEIATVYHAGQFRHAPQRNFAPSSTYLRSTQRGYERCGFFLQAEFGLHEILELLLDAAEGSLACRLQVPDLGLEADE